MLNDKGFDAWTKHYDAQVRADDDAGTYPFAGYEAVLAEVYELVRQYRAKTILDIGCGTGHLTTRLHNDGCEVYGIDFSQEMLKKAQEKMPHAHLMQYDFTFGLPPAWKNTKFDSIISTYALHHLDNKQKLALIKDLNRQLNKGGVMVLGDIAFETLHDMEMAREQAGEEWDEEEFYFIAEDVFRWFPHCTIRFIKESHCAGIFIIPKN